MKLSSLLIILFIFTSCKSATEPNILKNQIVNIHDNTTSIYKNNQNYVKKDLSDIEKFELNNASVAQREEILKNSIKKIKNIKEANVNIIGNISVVSLQSNVELDDKILTSLKNEISSVVKQIDSKIDHVAVNCGAEFFKKTKESIDISDDTSDKIDSKSDVGKLIEKKMPSM